MKFEKRFRSDATANADTRVVALAERQLQQPHRRRRRPFRHEAHQAIGIADQILCEIVAGEVGIDIARHKPTTFEELEDLEGLNFDLIVTLSPPAQA